MDPITQGLFGGSFALLSKRKELVKKKKIYIYTAGFLTGLLPDADILIKSKVDPLLSIEYHRAFTHSLFFVPIGALFSFIVLHYFFKLFKNYDLSKKELFLACLLGYLSHAPLDALTNYGTSLFIPFSDMRVSLNLISVVDLLFTLPLIGITIWGLLTGSRKLVTCLFAWMALIFSFNYINKSLATYQIKQLAWQRGHDMSYLLVKPTILNGHVWRTVYQYQDKYYVDAVFSLPWKQKIYEGGVLDTYNHERDFPEILEGSVAYNDFKRFIFFSDNLVSKFNGALIDVRFSPLPQTVSPMWSVIPKVDINAHVDFVMVRPTDKESRAVFFKMLRGESLGENGPNMP